MSQQRSHHSSLRRIGVVTTLGAALGVGGVVTLLGLGGPVHALEPADYEPVDPEDLTELLPPTEDDDPIFDGPIVSIPNGPDGPVFDGPIVTIPIQPGDDDDPIFDGPFVTIPIGPGDNAPPVDTSPPVDTVPPEEAPVEQPEGPGTPPADEAPTGPSGVAPFVHITSATVDCAGMVHVTYETGAAPQLAPENEHVVMFSPASNPAAVSSHRLFQRPVNGTFTVDLQSPAAEAYRVFVVADFEPANVDGVVLVDETDAPAPLECPVPAG
jgi:hypothetical protein